MRKTLLLSHYLARGREMERVFTFRRSRCDRDMLGEELAFVTRSFTYLILRGCAARPRRFHELWVQGWLSQGATLLSVRRNPTDLSVTRVP